MLKHLQQNKVSKSLALMLIFTFLIPCLLINDQVVKAATSTGAEQIHNEEIARGINFQENKYTDYQGSAGKKENEFIITADLNDPTVNIISGKANDKVLKLDTVSNQIAQEQARGQNVAAGINGDMFNMSAGTLGYGSPLGLQVKDGKILVGWETIWSGFRFPVFAIDKNHKALITYLSMDARLSVIDAGYEAAHGSANPDLSTSIDTINRNNTAVMDNQMILETPQLADNPTVGFTDAQATNGTLTVLKNITGAEDGSVKLGQEYTAEVVSIGDTSTGVKSILIPSDGMVLASQGIKATWVKKHLKAGDKVRFTFNLKDQAGNPLDLEQAVSAWLPLVENGYALTQADMLERCKNDWDHGTAIITAKDKARTAIGFTADNKVVALALDGGGAVKESYGIDLPGMAARMKELGVVAAVSLDGGGSTQMNTRLFGETNVQVIDCPSDGIERPVTNTIIFTSNAAKTHDITNLKVSPDITIYKNSTYTFQLRGQDSNGNPADLNNAAVKWSIRPGTTSSSTGLSGSIDKNGVFKAGNRPASEIVCAQIGNVTGSAKVNVVDSVYSLAFTDTGVLAVEPNIRKQLDIVAYTQDKQSIVIPNSAVQWSVKPLGIAAIDANGVLTPTGKGSGTITAKVGNKEAVINFVSGLDTQLIDGFELNDTGRYYVNGYVGGNCQTSTAQVKNGNYSLQVNYNYANWTKVYNGTINIYTAPEQRGASYTSSIRPKKLSMWVYGDGKAPWLRAILKDGNGNTRTLNLASNINWTGWKYVEAVIPEDIPMPISLAYFYMVETNKSKNLQGTVYFDDIRFSYSDNETLN